MKLLNNATTMAGEYKLKKDDNTFGLFHLVNGDREIIKATICPWEKLVRLMKLQKNECLIFCYCFDTVDDGKRYIYWTDENTNKVYLTPVPTEEKKKDSNLFLGIVANALDFALQYGFSELEQKQIKDKFFAYLNAMIK